MDHVIYSQSDSINNITPIDDKSKMFHPESFSPDGDMVLSDSENESINSDRHSEYWYNILYTIGSYMIDTANTLFTEDNISKSDHIITRVFCGYWVLYTIAINAERTKPVNNTRS